YANVYYHRTTRAIDLHLQEIFQPTMEVLCQGNPLRSLDRYLHLTDWQVIEAVRTWKKSRSSHKRQLGLEWSRILERQVKWKMAYSQLIPITQAAAASFHPHEFL